jgi:hypothetical protein
LQATGRTVTLARHGVGQTATDPRNPSFSGEESLRPTGNQLLIGLIVVAGGVWLGSKVRMHELGEGGRAPNEIEYQGQHFKLTKNYRSYDEYKNDPENLDPSEVARVEAAIVGAKVARSYPDRRQMVFATIQLQFPGYGLTHFGEKPQPDGSSLAGVAVEIPRANKERVLVFRGRDGHYTLIDDFVAETDEEIKLVREEAGRLVYCSFAGKPLVSRPLANP